MPLTSPSPPPQQPLPPKASPRPARLRRLLRWLAFGLVVVPVALYLSRAWTVYPLLLRLAQGRAEQAGWKLDAERLSGNGYDRLRLHGLRLEPIQPKATALLQLELDEGELEFRLLDLLRHGLGGVDFLRAKGLLLELNGDAAPAEQGAPMRLPDVPLELPGLSASEVRIRWQSADRLLTAEGASAELLPGPGPQHLRLDIPRGSYEHLGMQRDWQADFSGTWSAARIEQGVLRVDGHSLVQLDLLDLSRSASGEAELQARLGLPADAATLGLAFTDHEPRATLLLRELDLAALDLETWLPQAPRLAGHANLELAADGSEGAWILDGRLQTRQLHWNQARLGSLEALGGWQGDGLALRSLELLGPGGRWSAQDVRVPILALRSGRALEELRCRLQITSSDLPALLGVELARPAPEHQLDLAGTVAEGRLQLEAGGLQLGGRAGGARWEQGVLDLAAPDQGPRRVDLHASLDFQDLAQAGRLLGLPLRSGQVSGELDLSGELRNPQGGLRLSASNVAIASAAPVQLELAAAAQAEGLLLNELLLRRGDRQLSLVAPTGFELHSGGVRAKGLRLAGSGSLELDLEPAQGAQSFALRADGLDLTPWLEGFAPKGTQARGITGRLDYADGGWQADLRADELAVPGRLAQITLDLEGSLQHGQLRLDRAQALRGAERVLELSGEASLDPQATTPAGWLAPGPVELTGVLAWPAGATLALPPGWGGLRLRSGASGELRLSGTWAAIDAALDLEVPRLAASQGSWSGLLGSEGARVETQLRWQQNLLTLDRAVVSGGEQASLELSGQVELASDLPALLADTPSWSELPLALNGKLGVPDLRWCADLSDSLQRSSGGLYASFDVTGSAGDPRGQARVELDDASLRVSGLPPVEALNGSMVLTQRRFHLEGLRGELGSGEVLISGSLDLDAEQGADAWDLTLTGQDALLARSPTLRARADADLRLSGPLKEPLLSGSLGLRRVRLREDLDFLGLLQGRGRPISRREPLALVLAHEGLLADLRVAVRVRTVEPIEVLSNVATAGLRGSLQLEGRGNGLIPTGDLFLDPSSIKLPGGRLNLTGGLVRFDPAHPFAPRIDINGETRMAGYDISLHATGDIHSPQIDLSSTPALPVEKVLLLLLSGQVPSEGPGAGLTAARSLTVYLAKDLLSKWSRSGAEGGESWLDRLEIISGQEVSRSGLSTLEATYRLSDEADQAERTWYVVAERDRYEDVNFGLRFVVRLR